MSDNGKLIVGFQASSEEIEALDKLAEESERTRSAELRMALRAWLESHGYVILSSDEEAPKHLAAQVAVA